MLILGDGAGFVNMLKIKGLHNAIDSGIKAGQAIAETFDKPEAAADLAISKCKRNTYHNRIKNIESSKRPVRKL